MCMFALITINLNGYCLFSGSFRENYRCMRWNFRYVSNWHLLFPLCSLQTAEHISLYYYYCYSYVHTHPRNWVATHNWVEGNCEIIILGHNYRKLRVTLIIVAGNIAYKQQRESYLNHHHHKHFMSAMITI